MSKYEHYDDIQITGCPKIINFYDILADLASEVF